MPQILVVDDSPSVRESVRMILAPTWSLDTASLADDVPAMLAQERADLLILGLSLPLERPLGLLRDVLAADGDVRVLLLAESVHLSVARRIFNYRIEGILPKPFDILALRRRVSEILTGFNRLPTLREEMDRAEREAELPGADTGILLPPPLRSFIARAAATTAHMVIEGERGTGKSALALLVHRRSPWHASPCLRLDARGLDEERFAAALGRLAEANPSRDPRATLCIEDADALSPGVQLALRDLAEGVWPHGISPRVRRTSVRILATTSSPLADLAVAGRFREDLRQALSVLVLRLPPLRERTDEFEALARAFADDWARRTVRAPARFSPDALDRLRRWLWPGNLRELRAVVGRALALTDGDEIGIDAIRIVEDADAMAPVEAPRPTTREAHALRPARAAAPVGAPATAPPAAPAPPAGLDLLVQLLSHEIRNPLLAIKTFTQLIEHKFDDPDFRTNFYRLVREDVDRIDALVDAASMFAGFGAPRPTAVDVNALIDHALKDQEQTFLRKRIVVLRESGDDLPPALADRAQLAFALRAIIAKAADLMPEGSDIHFASAVLPAEGGRDARLETTIRFSNPDSFLTRMESVLTGEPAAEAPPGSIELALAGQMLARQGGTLRVEAFGERDSVITILLPVPPGASTI